MRNFAEIRRKNQKNEPVSGESPSVFGAEFYGENLCIALVFLDERARLCYNKEKIFSDREVVTMNEQIFDPEIFVQETDAVRKRVKAVRKKDSLVLLVFSDLHANEVDAPVVTRLTEAVKGLTEAIPTDAVVDLGDNLAMLGRDRHISNDDLQGVLDGLFGKVTEAAACPVFFLNGNHDAIGTDFFDPVFWNRILGEKFNRGAENRAPDGGYFTVDFEKSNTRLVCLSLPYDSDLEVKFPTPCWEFGQKQLQWLAHRALDTQRDVILCCHVPLYYEYRGDKTSMLGVWDGEKARQSYISALCGWISDREVAEGILDAFQAGEAFENAEFGISMPKRETAGRLKACFSGHTHVDSLWAPKEVRGEDRNPLPCPQAVVKSVAPPWKNITPCNAAVEMVVWTPSEQVFHLIRFGDGEDREIRL